MPIIWFHCNHFPFGFWCKSVETISKMIFKLNLFILLFIVVTEAYVIHENRTVHLDDNDLDYGSVETRGRRVVRQYIPPLKGGDMWNNPWNFEISIRCPHPNFIRKHLCGACRSHDDFARFAEDSNRYRTEPASEVTIFSMYGTINLEEFMWRRIGYFDKCELKSPVPEWQCEHRIGDPWRCARVGDGTARHNTIDGHFSSFWEREKDVFKYLDNIRQFLYVIA